MENLEQLSRGELQALAKAHGIKANKKNADLIAELRALPAAEQGAAADAAASPQEKPARKSVGQKRKSAAALAPEPADAEAVEGQRGAPAGADDYASMSRAALQALAKERGLKANAKTADLIKMLQGPAPAEVSVEPEAPAAPAAAVRAPAGRKSVARPRKSVAPAKSATASQPDGPEAEVPAPVAAAPAETLPDAPSAHEGRRSTVRRRSSVAAATAPGTPRGDGGQAESKSAGREIGVAAAVVQETDAAECETVVAAPPASTTRTSAASSRRSLTGQEAPEPKRRESSAGARQSLVPPAPAADGQAEGMGRRKSSACSRRSSAAAPALDGQQAPGAGDSARAKRASAVGPDSSAELLAPSTVAVTGEEVAAESVQAQDPSPTVIGKRRSSAGTRRSSTVPAAAAEDKAPPNGRRSSAGQETRSMGSLPSVSTLSPRSSLRTTGARSSAMRASLDTLSPTQEDLASDSSAEERKPKRSKSGSGTLPPAPAPASASRPTPRSDAKGPLAAVARSADETITDSPMSAALAAAGDMAGLAAGDAEEQSCADGSTVISGAHEPAGTRVGIRMHGPAEQASPRAMSADSACVSAPDCLCTRQ
jgi:hypothetical protein